MTPALPRNIQLKLEQTIAQWHQWHCEPPLQAAPAVVAVLAPGASNFSILVESEQHFVVRIDGINPATNGLNRQTEWRTLQTAHKAGIAPKPRYFNPELGSMVCDYLTPDQDQELCMTTVGTLLREIHNLPARHNRLDLAERILRYEKHLEHKHQTLAAPLQQCRERIFDLLDPVNQRPHTAVLCHNDLLRGNRIVSAGKLWAIDWEYCAMGNPWFDLAVVVTGDSLNTAQTEALLLAYLGAAPSDAQRMELTRHSCIYRYMELLWYQAQTHAVLEPPQLNDKMTALQRALQQYLT